MFLTYFSHFCLHVFDMCLTFVLHILGIFLKNRKNHKNRKNPRSSTGSVELWPPAMRRDALDEVPLERPQHEVAVCLEAAGCLKVVGLREGPPSKNACSVKSARTPMSRCAPNTRTQRSRKYTEFMKRSRSVRLHEHGGHRIHEGLQLLVALLVVVLHIHEVHQIPVELQVQVDSTPRPCTRIPSSPGCGTVLHPVRHAHGSQQSILPPSIGSEATGGDAG